MKDVLPNNSNPFGKEVTEIILEKAAKYNYPVCFDFPSGHHTNNIPLVFGKAAKLTVTNDQTSLTYL